ncbi:hypothetical protein [Aeromicrobium sp. 9AM]|uniref:DUF7426 family protein n=1 Tax=Aeromicrobium sp. 9AM TaxID=2653126 RepID=UPI0012F0299B|nr:hypothetical protein [Aeromicrobium sp. 9AM]VXB81906.1 conserved hypothetical protein [Aeromicrobium sp. 9AM]
MSRFKQLDQHFDPTLTLPVDKDHTYVIQPVDGKTGAWVTEVMSLAIRVRTGDVEPTEQDMETITMDRGKQEHLYQTVLGDVYQQMFDDGMNWEVVKLVGTTAVIWIHQGIEAAEEYWDNGGQAPKAQKKPQDRRRSVKKTSTASPAGTTNQPKTKA